MSKAVYTGVDGIARKVKKMYIGVDGVARKVKKAYIGVDGVARQFYISQLPGSIVPSAESVSAMVKANGKTTFTVTVLGDGELSVVSSDTSVATATISGTTVTVKCLKTGSATITVNMAESDDYSAASCDVALSVTVIGTLEATSWGTIKSVASNGANYWSVGDRKSVAISGTVGELAISGTYYCYILGFNHNSSIEGNGIHFQFGFTAASGGVNIAFCDSKYGDNGSTSGFRINTSTTTNSGGWSNSNMYNKICPAFLSALPSALQSAISACTKYSDNTGDGSNAASNVTSSSSKIWLLSEFEVQGARSIANSAEQNYQKQYAYYANGNSKIKYKSDETTTTCLWWLRSTHSEFRYSFCGVDSKGSTTNRSWSYSFGFAPAFKVA